MFTLDFFSTDSDPAGVSFRDVLFLMVLSLVVVIFLLTLLINPIKKRNEVPIRTEILIEATWPSDTAYDVDLWGMGPDGTPVGWGIFTAGPSLNLERDDRGKINDLSIINYEVMTVRSLDPGDYTINLHLYSEFNEPLPVPVNVRVTGKGDMGEIYSGEVLLSRRKEELTVVRFSLDEDGDLIKDSIHNLHKSILSHR
ncbi:MAG: hypothetical protein IID61_07610 [SAR324 cluster bacterium]|nr:hypothetical protein [SAR324 cluster bacterium]